MRPRLIMALAGLWLFLSLAAAPLARPAETGHLAIAADNSKALALFHAGRYAAAYAAFWPALTRGDPEAVLYGSIIRRNGLDGRAPAKEPETAALTRLLASRSAFMRQALTLRELPETTADAYRTALAQLVYAGQIPLERPPESPADYPAQQREEALALLFSRWGGAPANRYPPAQNFAAHLSLTPGGSPKMGLAVLRKSAEAGDRLGMISLSFFYREGLGGFRDDLKAAHWSRRAADSEPPLGRALNEVGYYYETGRGVTRDRKEARAWYEKSAARGYQPGRNNVERLNKAGREPPKNRPVLEGGVMF